MMTLISDSAAVEHLMIHDIEDSATIKQNNVGGVRGWGGDGRNGDVNNRKDGDSEGRKLSPGGGPLGCACWAG